MALKGIKVLEFAGLAPGPFCGMVLADFGASVIRIDKVRTGADLDFLSNGKQSIAVDLKQPAGVNLIKQLTRQSDVLIEPFRPGVMENLGLGPNRLCEENPRLVYARLTGFGNKGVYSKRAGHDLNYVAISGLLSLFGRRGEKPSFPLNMIADFGGGGLMCCLGILMALLERSTSNRGQVVDNSMVEGSAYLGSFVFRSQPARMLWSNERGRNVLDGGAHFYEVFETKDGKFMTVAAIEPQFYDELLDGLNMTRKDLDVFDFDRGMEVFKEKFLEKTQKEWCSIFDRKDACVFPVLSMEEAYGHAHNKANDSFFVDEDKTIIPSPAPKLSRTPGVSKATQARATSGADTIEIMKGLGYSTEKINEMQKAGVIDIANSKL